VIYLAKTEPCTLPSMPIFSDVCHFVDAYQKGIAKATNVEFAALLTNWQQNQFTSNTQMLMVIYKWKEFE